MGGFISVLQLCAWHHMSYNALIFALQPTYNWFTYGSDRVLNLEVSLIMTMWGICLRLIIFMLSRPKFLLLIV